MQFINKFPVLLLIMIYNNVIAEDVTNVTAGDITHVMAGDITHVMAGDITYNILNNNVMAAGTTQNIHNNNVNVLNNNTEIINTSDLIDFAVSTMTNCQANLNIQIPINIILKSFNDNQDIILSNIYNRNRYDLLSFQQKLSKNNIEISLLNKYTAFDISNELFQIHFKNALNNHLDLANTILQISLERANNKKVEMFNIISIVKNMSKNNKQILNNYLLNNWKQTIKFLNTSIKYCKNIYFYLSILHPINNPIILNIKNSIREIFKNTLDYLNYEKECLVELGLEQYM